MSSILDLDMAKNKISFQNDQNLALLNKFLVDNPELEELSARLSTFNILNVLRIERTEIRHSNVLAWLMDPQGSHGIGQAFIRRVLSTILLQSESSDIKLTPAQVELMDFFDVEVLREWNNIDLLAISRSNKCVLLIENKIKAGVSKRQLLKYIEIVRKYFPKFIVIPVLLTLEPYDDPDIMGDTGYITYSHAQMYHVTNHVIRQRQDRIPEDTKMFIEHYLEVLRRLTMQDKQIAELCKTIYRKHKDAIDLIVEYGATTQFGVAAEEFMAQNRDLVKLSADHRWLWFVPKIWEEKMPACSNLWKHLSKQYPISCWFSFDRNTAKIGFIIEIGSLEDAEKRKKLVTSFVDAGFKVTKRAFRPESKYTRVYSTYKRIENTDDKEEIEKHMNNLWKKGSSALEKTTELIRSFKW